MMTLKKNIESLDELKFLYQKVLLLGEKLCLCDVEDVSELTNERHRLLNRVVEQTSVCREFLSELESSSISQSEIAQINEYKQQIFDFAPQLNHQNERIRHYLSASMKEARQEMMGHNHKQKAIRAYSNYSNTGLYTY